MRLAYPQPLPLRLKAAIGHLHHFEWRDPTDNENLLAALVDAIDARPRAPADGSPKAATAPSRLARGEHFIVTEQPVARRGDSRIAGRHHHRARRVRSGDEPLRHARHGPGFFRVKVTEQGALEVAIWSGASYRRVRSQPRKFIALMEGDTHSWCFAQLRARISPFC